MSNYINYRGQLLAKNSEAYKLYVEKKFSLLDKHLKRLHQEAVARGEIREQA